MPSQRLRDHVEREGGREGVKTVSSGQDGPFVPMNSLQLCLSVQDPFKNKPDNIPAWMGEGSKVLPPPAEEPLTAGEGREGFLKSMWPLIG